MHERLLLHHYPKLYQLQDKEINTVAKEFAWRIVGTLFL